ncbi:MAG: VPLPA-CTERM sorting domain-containing protein [Pseudomonadota bacterium]
MRTLTKAGAVAAFAVCAAPAAQAASVEIANGVTDIAVVQGTFDLLATADITLLGDTGLTAPTTLNFGISGGTVDTETGDAVIEHDGVGVQLTLGAGTDEESSVSIGDFVIDTAQATVFGTLNGGTDLLPYFLFAEKDESEADTPGIKLVLSDTLSGALEGFFGLEEEALEGATFGFAETNPTLVPLPAAGWMLLAALGGLGVMRRNRAA